MFRTNADALRLTLWWYNIAFEYRHGFRSRFFCVMLFLEKAEGGGGTWDQPPECDFYESGRRVRLHGHPSALVRSFADILYGLFISPLKRIYSSIFSVQLRLCYVYLQKLQSSLFASLGVRRRDSTFLDKCLTTTRVKKCVKLERGKKKVYLSKICVANGQVRGCRVQL